MLALRVSVNGAKPVTAGFSGPRVLSAVVMSVVRDPGRTPPAGEPLPERELELSLGGLDTTAREHVNWANVGLAPGDKIVVEVVELASVDTPASRRVRRAEPGAPAKPAKSSRTAKPSRAAEPDGKRAVAQPASLKRGASKAALGKPKRRP